MNQRLQDLLKIPMFFRKMRLHLVNKKDKKIKKVQLKKAASETHLCSNKKKEDTEKKADWFLGIKMR
jgi:hypothetical protein